jgi:hypothetical protein
VKNLHACSNVLLIGLQAYRQCRFEKDQHVALLQHEAFIPTIHLENTFGAVSVHVRGAQHLVDCSSNCDAHSYPKQHPRARGRPVAPRRTQCVLRYPQRQLCCAQVRATCCGHDRCHACHISMWETTWVPAQRPGIVCWIASQPCVQRNATRKGLSL